MPAPYKTSDWFMLAPAKAPYGPGQWQVCNGSAGCNEEKQWGEATAGVGVYGVTYMWFPVRVSCPDRKVAPVRRRLGLNLGSLTM